MGELALLQAALKRERAARAEAERLLESKTRELYLANQAIIEQNVALQEQQKRLVHTEKMASIGLLSAGVAHEINNPVGYAYSNMQMLKENMPLLNSITGIENFETAALLADLPSMIDETLEGLERVRSIVDDMRGFARKGADVFQQVDLRAEVQRVINLLSNETKYLCNVVLSLEEIPLVECSAERIGQVMLNLIFNAAQAISRGGKITISTRRVGGLVALTVEDDGKGISKADLGELFSPFFTTKMAGEGTGMGLFICYNIVAEHGGEILVHSEFGVGSRFDVILPISQSDARPSQVPDVA
jgi:two-component system NtrC family sensor kinase